MDNMEYEKTEEEKLICISLLRNSNNIDLFETLGELWKDDDDVVKEALSINPLMYEHISDRLKLDRELALFAVKSDINVHAHLLKRFKRDKFFLIEAVTDNGALFQKIHKSFKGVKEIAYLALKDDPTVVSSFSFGLTQEIGKNDPLKYLEASILLKELNSEISENRIEPKKVKI